MGDSNRWRMMEEERSLVRPDWLPTSEEWPAFAEYHEEHVRLLGLQAEAVREYGDLRRRFEAEETERNEALTSAFLSGGIAEASETTPPEQQQAALREVEQRVEAVNDALLAFLQRAIAEIKERAVDFYGEIQEQLTVAEEKRAEAERLLAEADQVIGGTKRKQNWLDRTTGRSTVIGFYPFGQMEVPLPPEQPDWGDVLAGGQVMEVEHV